MLFKIKPWCHRFSREEADEKLRWRPKFTRKPDIRRRIKQFCYCQAFHIPYVLIFMFGIRRKNHCCKTSGKCPIFWLELPWLKILKVSQRSLKKFKDLERLQNFEDFNTILRAYSGKIMVVSVLDLWILQSVSKEKTKTSCKICQSFYESVIYQCVIELHTFSLC